MGWTKAEKMQNHVFGGFFVLWVGVLRLQKLVHEVRAFAIAGRSLDKKCDKIRGLHFFSFWTQKGWLLFFGVCF